MLSVLPEEADTYTYIDVPYLKNNKSSNESIIRDICSSLNQNGPQLSIIEAPAGFGKTCTSYEIINHLVEDKGEHPIPFFTEFSRDRQARVFSHILVREVDKSFSSVNSDVVINEVKKGRIAIILDGFDELLHDSSSNDENNEADGFENAEPMLETISELLTNNAKIVLTSRRSAIFDGELFNEWIERYKNQFTVNRYRISEPTITDWIPALRLEELNKTTVNVNSFANPVLLSFLRFVNDEYFSELCEKPYLIVDRYFLSMLEREMDRQDLRMNANQQAELLTLVASDMCDHNYTSDSKEKIINTIKEKAGYILNEVRASYPPVDKPSIDKLATTLSNHAFFDRSNQEDSNIQFVNEFVFGNYVANSILGFDGEWMASDERFIEPAVLSYVSRDEGNRLNLWGKLNPMTEFLDASTRMKFEGFLTGMINDVAYNDSEITSISLSQQKIFSRGSIENCVIKNCTFTGCFFYFDNFMDVTFLNCTFWDCDFEKNNENELAFYNCNDNSGFIDGLEKTSVIDAEESEPNIEHYILSKIWPVGQSSIKSLHYFTSNLFKTDLFSRKEIIKSIKSLKRSGYLEDAHDVSFVAINKNKISEIKSILGRNN
ncbi:hypothetical protein A9Q88_01825 [Gammaproteobacteria bacterium 50_400_T64]|nr:hypothetical protein A9Q88_01825 [Gammaproteobacteria bacterium 50_400_T64]